MTATTIVGIDPGATGAIAMIQPMVMRTFDANTTRPAAGWVHLDQPIAMPL